MKKRKTTYNYLYKRKKRVPVKLNEYLHRKLVYISMEVNKTYNYYPYLLFNYLTTEQLLDKFEELVDNVDNPKLIRELADKYDKNNKNRTHF